MQRFCNVKVITIYCFPGPDTQTTLTSFAVEKRLSGGKNRLLGIRKHGNSSLRGLLVHGASVQRVADKRDGPRSQWLVILGKRRHRNIATVAMANKTARTA